MEVEYLESKRSVKKGTKPTIITWGKKDDGSPNKMVRGHSIRSVAKEITNMSANQDFISINVIGKQATGKTELCKGLACLVHNMSEFPYNVLHLGKKELLNLEETMKGLEPTNHILIFDDIAFLSATASKQQIDQIQQVLSVIRHLEGGKDVKIILFKSFQYTKAISPFMRQNDMTFISSVDDNEQESLISLVGKHNSAKVSLLKRLQVQVKIGEKNESYFSTPLGDKGKYFRYHAKHPFLPYLYYNGSSCKLVVSPLRTWHTPHCPTCDHIDNTEEVKHTLEEFAEIFLKRFGSKSKAMTILKVMAIQRGINCFAPEITRGIDFGEKFLKNNKINFEALMKRFNLERTKAHYANRKDRNPEVTENV